MVDVPLSPFVYNRTFGYLPEIALLNRFFEENPANRAEGVALLARPGTALLTAGSTGTVWGFYSSPGLFSGDLFFGCGTQLFRYSAAGVLTPITGVLAGPSASYSRLSFCSVVGPTFQRLFLADGQNLMYYPGPRHATGTLSASAIAANDTIEIGGVYYRWVAVISNGAGTVGDPWKVLIGGTVAASLLNMEQALNLTGTAGVTYSANLASAHPDGTAVASASTIVFTSNVDTAAGNLVTTTVPVGAGLSWATPTLQGGGVHSLTVVAMPDGVPAKSVAALSQYVLVSVSGTDRVYYIEPAETSVAALNFFTAEASSDPILDLLTVGDVVWMLGSGSIEAWYATGDLAAPFLPARGRAVSRGVLDGTAVLLNDVVYFIGTNGVVYAAAGGGLERISTNAIEERIRLQLEREQP